MREVDRMAEILEELLVLSRAGERELPGERVDLRAATLRAASAGSRRPPTRESTSRPPTVRNPPMPGAPRRTSTVRSTWWSRTRCATPRAGRA